jgi:nucleoside-diphosphate kinase
LIPLNPNSVQRGLIGDIIKRFEQKGFKLVAMKLVHASQELLQEHYKDLAGRPFFPGLVAYMVSGRYAEAAGLSPSTDHDTGLAWLKSQSSGPVVAMVWEGLNAVSNDP